MRRLTLLASTVLMCAGLFAQSYDAETIAKMRAEKKAAEAMELTANKDTKKVTVNASKEDILMQTGTVTTCSANFYDTGGSAGAYLSNQNHTLTLLPATAGAQVMVTFTAFACENNYDFLKIYNGTSASAPQLANLTGTSTPAAPFIGSNAEGALTFVFTSDGSVNSAGWAATVTCFTLVENNLAAMALTGTAFGTEGTEKVMGVTVKNMGSAAVAGTAYTVELVDANANVLATAPGVDLASNESTSISLAWTPAAAGTIVVKGVVDFAADQDMSNNETSTMSIEIMASGAYVAQIGTATTFPPSRVPFDFYYKNSAAQTIYYPSELGIGGGLITAIAYRNNFATDLSAGKGIKVWIGETTATDLTAGWVDPASLTLVYSGNISLPASANDILITLTTPYVYTGGNLVIYTCRDFEDAYYSSSDKFYGTEYPASNRTRRLSTDTQFDPATPGAGTVINWAPNTTIFFSTEGLGALEGDVTTGGNALAGVSVKLVGTPAMTTSNAAGHYSFPYLIGATYNMEFSKHGFETATVADVVVVGDETTVVDVTLSPIMQYMVSGTVTASDTQLGLEGATVTLEGYADYTATTDANGHYAIANVYGDNRVYDVTVTHPSYSTYTGTVTVNDAHINNLNVVVEEVAYPAVSVVAAVNAQENVDLSWQAPGTLVPAEWRYDNGTQTGQLGAGSGTANTVLGSVYRVNAQIHEMSWYTTAEGGPHATVNAFIFALNASGEPTNTILYSAMNVANTDGAWTTHELATPVDAPNGFYIAISYVGFAGLGTTTPDAEYPLVPSTQCFSMDYTAGSFAYVESLGDPTLENNFMMRAYGYDMGKTTTPSYAYTKSSKNEGRLQLITNSPVETGSPVYSLNANSSKVMLGYSVYRLTQGQAPAEWTLLSNSVTTTSYSDNTWSTLPAGMYQYAVVANYTNGVTSVAALSNVLPRAMEVAYAVNITTNTSDNATGAVVTLANVDGLPAHTYTLTAGATGVNFPTVWRGTYNITIAKTGFNAYSATNIAIDAPGLSHTAQLIETIVEPFGLARVQQGDNEYFSWNNAMGFTDDIESYADFAFETIGNYTQNDVDGSATYTINGATFTNQGYTGSYIVFNPSAVTPALTTAQWAAHGGSKYLACFAATTPSNNDWIITPAATISNGMVFSFWAKSVTDLYGLERFNVLVSTNGGTTPADFTVISGSTFVQAPIDWTEYSYNLNAYAGQNIRLAIQCVSNDAFVFMVDDINVGMPKGDSKSFTGYTVYLDGTQVAQNVQATNYTFPNVSVGQHTAGVKAVYSSGSSTTQTITFDHVVPTYTVTFNVKRQSNNVPISGASIVIDGETLTTNMQGVATIDLENGTYDYVVTKTGFGLIADQVVVNGAAMTVNVLMTGMEEDLATQNVVLYPNPVADMLTIVRNSTSNAVVEIYANNGALVKTFQMNEAQTEQSVSDLNSGVYMVRIIENQATTVQRFIKQ